MLLQLIEACARPRQVLSELLLRVDRREIGGGEPALELRRARRRRRRLLLGEVRARRVLGDARLQ